MLSFCKLITVRSQAHNVLGNRYVLHAFGGQQQQHIAGLKTVEERIGVPIRPKRPLVPFLRFYRDIRPNLIQQNPAQTMGILARLAASKWKLADQQTKDKYNDEYRMDQEVFVKEIARYQNTITDEQREKVKQMKLLISEKRKSRVKRQKARELGKPKHPVPAFTQYLTEQTTKVDKSKVIFREFAVKMGEQWRGMSDSEKAQYMDKYKVDMVDYKKEIQKWEEKMIKSGNKDLVRRKSLMETNSTSGGGTKKETKKKAPAAAAATKPTTRVSIHTSSGEVPGNHKKEDKAMAVEPIRPLVGEEKVSSADESIKVAEEKTKASEAKKGRFFKFF